MALNLCSCLCDSALRYPDHPAILCDGQTLSFAELDRLTAKIGEVLLSKGLKKGDNVMLLAPNVPEFTAAYYGILRAGGAVVPVNTLLLPQEITELLDHSDARFMIAWNKLAEKALEAFETSESCLDLFLFGMRPADLPDAILAQFSVDSHAEPNIHLLDTLLEGAPGMLDTVQTSPDDTAVILYTSGTTGRAKGVELSHFNIYSNALYTKDRALLIGHDSITIAILPLFHTFGQTAIQNASMLAGASMVMVPQFEPKKTLGEIEAFRVTHIAAVPTMYNLMIQTQRRRPYDVASLRVAISGGASLSRALFDEFRRVFGFNIVEGYGLSETSPITNVTPVGSDLIKPGSIGPEFFGTHVRVLRDDGTFAGVEEVGELVVRGHNVMKGYYKDPSSTKLAFVDGWFRTGDIGYRDADRYFYLVDRKKDVIIRAGMNIYPREIEEVLHHHPAIREVSVLGIPDETLSENILACVVLEEGANVTVAELQKYCRDHLAPYKCPKMIDFMDRLPKGSTGKILKRELREMKRKEHAKE